MIENKIKSLGYRLEQLRKAISHDFDGYYVLIIENDAYVMDYNSYGFTHIYSYSKKEDANVMIRWYLWKLLPNNCFNDGEKPQYCGMGNMIVANVVYNAAITVIIFIPFRKNVYKDSIEKKLIS